MARLEVRRVGPLTASIERGIWSIDVALGCQPFRPAGNRLPVVPETSAGGGRRLDQQVGELRDLISEAQVGPSSTSMTAHRRTSQIVPSEPEAYYLPRGNGRYEPTRATESPWDRKAQHGGPPAALLAHVIDQTVEGPLRIGRISVDILGPIPLREVVVEVVIVVEDEVALSNLVRSHLEQEGHSVEQAFDGFNDSPLSRTSSEMLLVARKE